MKHPQQWSIGGEEGGREELGKRGQEGGHEGGMRGAVEVALHL